MKDSEIPAFTSALLRACQKAAKEGKWSAPLPPGNSNLHCCPILVFNGGRSTSLLNDDEAFSFFRGYDLREASTPDHRFKALGQAFRKIADTIGFE